MSLTAVCLRIPGTCGEWIQTLDQGKECLVSLPINRYTTVTMRKTTEVLAKQSQAELLPKSLQALQMAAKYYNISTAELNHVSVDIQRDLEIGKGMASSTADLYGIILGLVKLFDKFESVEALFKLCCQLEASDSIMFDTWTLVNHLDGIVLEQFKCISNLELLMLTPESIIETESLRGTEAYQMKINTKTGLPLELFREALKLGDLERLGQAATCSLVENEAVLEKAHLEALIALSKAFNCYGVVGGHSGTVCGLMLHAHQTDKAALLEKVKSLPLSTYYTNAQFVSTVCGGAEIMYTEA